MAMLAKTPEGRPETALHVADRAEVIMSALRRGSGAMNITMTSEIPQVPDYPTSTAAYDEEPSTAATGGWLPRSPGAGSSRAGPEWRSAGSPRR